jgi:RND family efflux transporter MFP subunit
MRFVSMCVTLMSSVLFTACDRDTGGASPASVTPAVVAAPASPATDTAAADTALPSRPPVAPLVSGTLEPAARAVLRAELSGAIRTLAVKVGDRVSAGQLLATLDVPAVRAADAASHAQLLAQETAQRQTQRERERVAQLLAIGGVSRGELDEWDARVQAADAAVEAARAQRASTGADVARLTVRAPFAGIVERRTATAGSVVQAGDELLSVIDARTLELEASVAAAFAAQARPGARVALRIAGWDTDTVIAPIVRVAPALDPVTRQLRITVQVPNAAGRWPAGAWAEGSLLTTPATTATRRGR